MAVLPDEQFQRIQNNFLYPPELDLSPRYVQEFYLDNIFRRSLSLNTALSPTGEKVLVATPAGILKVAVTGAGFDTYEVKKETAANDYEVAHSLTPAKLSSRWDILVETFDAIISWRNVGDSAYSDDIVLPIGMYSFDVASIGIQWKNRKAGENSEVQVVGWR